MLKYKYGGKIYDQGNLTDEQLKNLCKRDERFTIVEESSLTKEENNEIKEASNEG